MTYVSTLFRFVFHYFQFIFSSFPDEKKNIVLRCWKLRRTQLIIDLHHLAFRLRKQHWFYFPWFWSFTNPTKKSTRIHKYFNPKYSPLNLWVCRPFLMQYCKREGERERDGLTLAAFDADNMQNSRRRRRQMGILDRRKCLLGDKRELANAYIYIYSCCICIMWTPDGENSNAIFIAGFRRVLFSLIVWGFDLYSYVLRAEWNSDWD